jgi:hypothetical protein
MIGEKMTGEEMTPPGKFLAVEIWRNRGPLLPRNRPGTGCKSECSLCEHISRHGNCPPLPPLLLSTLN